MAEVQTPHGQVAMFSAKVDGCRTIACCRVWSIYLSLYRTMQLHSNIMRRLHRSAGHDYRFGQQSFDLLSNMGKLIKF